MKKDIYVVVGIVALVLTGALVAFGLYRRAQAPAAAAVAASESGRVDQALLLGEGSPSLGPTMARVQIVEFLDPECESCRAMHPYLKAILKDYEGRVRYTLRYMPFHKNSTYAAALLEAAREQGKYWESLDLVFDKQPEWGAHHAPRPDLLVPFLKTLGLDAAKLEAAAKNPDFAARVQRDKEDGMKAGVTGTPTFFVNGRMLADLGDRPLRALIDEELSAAE